MTLASAPPRRRARRIAAWTAVAAAFVLVGLLAVALGGGGPTERGALDPESAGPSGARAVVRVLEEQGIDVRIARDRAAAERTLAELDGLSTLVLPDAPAVSDAALEELTQNAGELVLIEPRSASLRLLMDGSAVAGAAPPSPIAPECDDADAERAGDIVAGAVFSPGADVEACYPADGAFALLRTGDGQPRTAVDGRALLANDSVSEAGNAALALSILGAQPTVVWYVPAAGDGDLAAPTLGELTPPWVTPAIALLLLSALVAGIWRGRRFGPLVTENLPVLVRAEETTVGRGRLYARSRDVAHAAEQLRRPSRTRIAALLGLGAAGGAAAAVADAAAARLGTDPAAVRRILVDDPPADERALVDLSDNLRDLEARVRAAVRPEGTRP